MTFTVDIIKGVQYAFFSAATGTYTATYAADTTRPTVTSTSPRQWSHRRESEYDSDRHVQRADGPDYDYNDAQSCYAMPQCARTGDGHLQRLDPYGDAHANQSACRLRRHIPPQSRRVSRICPAMLWLRIKTWSFTTAAATRLVLVVPGTAQPRQPTPRLTIPNAVELGVKFRVDLNGFITGIRFYKGTTNTGTHVGTLWSSAGQSLATATFMNETASGWQQVNFSSPVAVTANTVYVASYHTNTGNYAANNNFFASSGVDNAPVHLLQDGVSGGNGVYAYSASSTFPSNTYQSSNYWVDVVFTVGGGGPTPLSVSSTTPVNNATGVRRVRP